LIPGAENALHAALDAGALGAGMSGAGPSLIAFQAEKDARIGAAMQQAFEKQKTPVRIFELSTTDAGAVIR
jgi:homoserine kinase